MSEEGAAESIAARKQRRRMAGRSGGEFEIVRNGEGIDYRYVWPNKEEEFVDRLVSWASAEPTQDSVIESDKTSTLCAGVETNEDNPDGGSLDVIVRDNGTKAANDDTGCIKRTASGKEDGKEQGAFTRLNRRISGWFQRRKHDGKENEREKGGMPASEQDQPWIPEPQLSPFKSESLTKELMEPQDDRISRHEEVNRDFFTAARRSVESTRQFESAIRCSEVVGDEEFGDCD
ncbi:uncharacterized protein Z520_04259 [Fonsecaea multimorphosa CBS 102226]|uniref:Uncharacterized protein n=1 Tax=Fonsecaea multimorphosa CBS 102226 TaxID=1442371 RepID=A0A0D2HCJ2_9EURO|nr:uncharacterized protein Z520_04259 [Fonsecaea multimorphosa CBS 102226]KIX99625.1 hypothetical protein Z520_04259 [Fonsecaea multimorphosa CBS 102226]OAL26678.1 hypothetical protein AYO22_04031 [Fonsecaea multimorphosa]